MRLPSIFTGSLGTVTPMLSVVHRSAAFFDLDKTIIARSSALAFGRPFRAGGLINRRAALKAAYAQMVYLVAGADEDQMNRMRDYVTEMCTGWDVQQVREIVAETLFDIVDPLIYAEAADLIEEHKAGGREVVIVSSSGEEVVGPIGTLVGADRVIATRMVIEAGRYTGQVDFYAYGPAKAAATCWCGAAPRAASRTSRRGRSASAPGCTNMAAAARWCIAGRSSSRISPTSGFIGRPAARHPSR